MTRGLDLELYARVLAELAHGQSDLRQVLARHGLSQEQWAELSARGEAALDVADDSDDTAGLERFAAAFAAAQAEFAGGPASFEEWLEVLVALQRGEALPAALLRLNLNLDRYLATQAHWAQRVAKDAELNARLQSVLMAKRRR